MSDPILNNLNPPLSQSSPEVLTSTRNSKPTVLWAILLVLLLISITLNVLQFTGYFFENSNNGKVQNLPISPDNPNLIRYGTSYYFKGHIKDVKIDGKNLELTTNIKDLPKISVDDKTNILIKNGDKFDPATRDQITPGKNVNLLLFNSNLEGWSLSRIVMLP